MGENEQAVRVAYRKAFSEGCDARLAGQSANVNPYVPKISSNSLYLAFQSGWRDVDEHWGVRVRNRWSFPPLPPLPDQSSGDGS
jgi:ribosome modulation factor